MTDQRSFTSAFRPTILLLAGIVLAATGALVLVVIAGEPAPGACAPSPAGAASSIELGPPGTGERVGASEYGGPGDAAAGAVGSSGVGLSAHPDSYAELGGTSFQTATAMGGLAYMTPLRITWGARSAIAYKRDIGLGGGPVAGLPRVIDLWWQLAGRIGIPYERGQWSGPVRVQRAPSSGAGGLLGQAPPGALTGQAPPGPQLVGATPGTGPVGCPLGSLGGVPITSEPHAQLLTGGLAAAPRNAPLAVKLIIAAGNQIVGKPYQWGAAHGLPLDQVAAGYDCSSSVEHLLYGARLLPVTYAAASSALESFGQPGPGSWVTIYANADHVFMYVAGLRWDTHDAAGSGDGSTGIGWHPLVRGAGGFVARHPEGL